LEDSIFQVKRLMIQLLQWTCVAGYISVNDLTEVMYGIGHRTMYPFFSIAFAAILYIIITIIVEWIYKILCKKIKENAIKHER
jgi:ABC-type amino acid transport system permease subunit